MRSTVTDRSFAPSTLSVPGWDANAGNRFRGEAIREGMHPYGAGRGGPMELRGQSNHKRDTTDRNLQSPYASEEMVLS